MTETIRRILAATDLSEASRVAIRRAAQLARQHGAQLVILHVVRPTSVLPEWLARAQPMLANEEELTADLRGRLTSMAVEAGLGPEDDLSLEVRFGKPAHEIAHLASAIDADLLVLGAHGESGMVESLVGTTAHKATRMSDVPVLVVKTTPHAPYRRVLASTDFTESAMHAMHFAARLAPAARIELFHAYDVPYFTLMTHAGVSDDAMGDYRKMAFEDAKFAMTEFVSALGEGFETAPVLLRHGYAPTLIRQHVHEQGTELVAVGAHGKGVLGTALLGSVSSRVLVECPCDVLVVKLATAH
ncbi:MAG TPA: universal stress protein [Xanthomonadaceae bacterium]|nr:universal stress protein [Xanthomonadaceae bacterium]